MSVQSQIDRLNAIKQRIRTNLVAQGITVPEDTMLEAMAEQILSVAGEDGQRGTGLLSVTTAPSSYTTAVGGITPKYRMAISTIKSQAGVTEVLLGDTIRYSYYQYPIAYLDASYAYCTTRVSLRGSNGKDGADYSFDPTVYGLPILELTGDTTGMTKDNAVTLSYEYGENSGSCTLKWQGSSSLAYEKKNYTIKLDNAVEIVEGWGAQNKYCLKANFIDHTHARNIVSARLWGQIVASRSSIHSNLKTCPNYGAIDGFPVVIVLNGEFHGLYTFNIPKDGWMFGLVEDNTKTQAIVGANNHTTATKFKGELVGDESDFELEFVSDKTNAGWVAISLNRLINACINSWGGDLDTTVAKYLDWDSAIDYYILTVLVDGRDMTDKNYLLTTYDGTKWYFSAYDMDSTYGLRWNGKQTYRPNDTAGDAVTFTNFANKHRLFELILRFKTDALKARYDVLKKSVFSKYALTELFENFVWAIPSPVLVEDVKLYPSIPGSSANNVDQVLRWLHHRLEIMDEWIEALPAQEEPVNPVGYTNQVPLSIDTDGSVFNGVGYKNGLRLSSTGVAKDNDWSTVTGYIEAKPGDVIRVVGVDWYSHDSNYLCAYDSSFTFIGAVYSTFKVYGQTICNVSKSSVINEHDVLITLNTKVENVASDGIAYIRVSSLGVNSTAGVVQDGANMIVTVNEEIT